MADDPFFPQPRAKASYREAAQRELVVNDAPAEDAKAEDAPSADVIAAQKPVVGRPLLPEELPPSVKKAPKLGLIALEEQQFWGRQSLVARYPRVFAGVLTIIGALSTFDSVWTLTHGGFYSQRALFGPPMLAAGIFPLIFGFPNDAEEGNPRWWKIGYGVTFGMGVLLGFMFVYSLTAATTAVGR